MIHIALPHPDHIIYHWDEIEPFIKLACDESNGELTPDVVKSKVEMHKIVIAVVYDDDKLVAAISFDIIDFESGIRALNIQCAGGDILDEWFEQIEAIANSLAKEHGCKNIYIIGRAGWARKMKGLGYKTIHTVIAKEVI